MFFRQFAEELGYEQLSPSKIKEDNQSAINLTIALAVSKKSRHIFIRHHFIRDLNKRRSISPIHCGTHDMIVYFRRKLFGVPR
jgi:hypothetical protein